MMKSRTSFFRVVAVVSAIVIVAVSANAAGITWGAGTTISTDTDVSTSGVLLYAYCIAGPQLINSTPFAGGGGISAHIESTINSGPSNVGSGSDPYNSLSAAYKNMLARLRWTGSPGTITLKDLTVGHNYQVQFWINDSRAMGSGDTADISSTGGNTVTLDYNSTDLDGGVGQYSIGTFTADASTQMITITSANAPACRNAIQLRDLSATPNLTWDTPVTISSDSDVSTEGTLLYAYTFGSAQTVNTVPFALTSNRGDFGGDGNITTTGFTGQSSTAFGSTTSPPYIGLTAAYQDIIKGAAWTGTSIATVTLNNLIASNRYQVQIWSNDSRSNGGNDYEWLSSTDGGAVILDQNSIEAAGGVGQYSLGTFVATSTSQQFTLLAPATGVLNAIQVRLLPPQGPVGLIFKIR